MNTNTDHLQHMDITKFGDDFKKIAFKLELYGESNIPFTNDDLAVQGVIELLNHIDIKNYSEANKDLQADEHFKKILEALNVAFGRKE